MIVEETCRCGGTLRVESGPKVPVTSAPFDAWQGRHLSCLAPTTPVDRKTDQPTRSDALRRLYEVISYNFGTRTEDNTSPSDRSRFLSVAGDCLAALPESVLPPASVPDENGVRIPNVGVHFSISSGLDLSVGIELQSLTIMEARQLAADLLASADEMEAGT